MSCINTIKRRTCIRHFSDKKIDKKDIIKLLKVAVSAPNAGNLQYWRFYVIRKDKIKAKIAQCAGHQNFIKTADTVIIVGYNYDEVYNQYSQRGVDKYSLQATAMASQNMLLAATELGFGGVFAGAFDDNELKKVIKMPTNEYPTNILAFGYLAQKAIKPKRKKLTEVVKEVL